ncbi:MAG: methyltransferase domain-containing protein [candidate division NC10 bacterium]|nr:methyltransferase domain-containing protein [candidate division NC10 bacterium]
MIAKLFMAICRLSPYLRKVIWRRWYQFLTRSYKRKDWSFINYGYASLDPQTDKLQLDDADEQNRYCIQLYHHVVNVVDLRDLRVLEVGSGRGGGAYYIKRSLGPKRVVGVDFSRRAVAFCNKSYSSVEGLSFVAGDAEFLPFRDNSFDVVVNVESSHCYGSMNAFLMQVKRVLREGGYFLYTDFRDKGEVDILHKQLDHSGMTLIKETNITMNVIGAMNLDNERKMALIQAAVHKMLLRPFQEFAGVIGSMMYEGFRTGEVIYSSFVLQKPNHQ